MFQSCQNICLSQHHLYVKAIQQFLYGRDILMDIQAHHKRDRKILLGQLFIFHSCMFKQIIYWSFFKITVRE